MNALRGNTHLERLEFPFNGIDDPEGMQGLVYALLENKGLVHLRLVDCTDNWNELLESMYMHPFPRSLDLRLCPYDLHTDPKKRREATKAVADMLSVNERIEVMSFEEHTFDRDDWNTNVAPRLECNLYRKCFPSIQTIGEASTGAAVLARALAKFASKPHLVLMLLNQNHDIISSFLDSAMTLDDFSPPSRKRSRSPSSDTMISH
jgi:hypothetical protein